MHPKYVINAVFFTGMLFVMSLVSCEPIVEEKMSNNKPLTNSLGMKFAYIPPGTYTMGSLLVKPGRDRDESQRRVTLSNGFYLQTTEVTVGQWRAFVQDTRFKTEAETGGGACIWTGSSWEKKGGYYWDKPGFDQTEKYPVTCVSWNDAQAFVRWLNHKEGQTYRLPTEEEWEYACRAASTTAFANGGISELECGRDRNLDAMGWYCGNSGEKTHPVARKKPNTWGLYDMHGNVWEWCQDCYSKYREGSSPGHYRVTRGGSWSDRARYCQSASRGRRSPGGSDSCLGFRLAMTP